MNVRFMRLLLVFSLVVMGIFPGAAFALTPEELEEHIHWYGKQASIKIEAVGKIIYIDPFSISTATNDADIILLTHMHQDHYSPRDIKKVVKDDTIFVAPEGLVRTLGWSFKTSVAHAVEPGVNLTLDGIQVDAVPAYNIQKTEYHPKTKKWVGYVLTLDGVKVYHTGDTERVPEMQEIVCDIILLPLGQTYTMNSVEEAADVVRDVKAKIAIPMHFGQYEGTAEDAQTFADLLKDEVRVVIKEQE